MTNLHSPKKQAWQLAQQLRKFRAKTEETAPTFNADAERMEVVREIDWTAYNSVIEQLEFLYKNK